MSESLEETGLSHHSVKTVGKSRDQVVGFVILPLRNNSKAGKTPRNRINWNGEPSGYAEIPDNWIFV